MAKTAAMPAPTPIPVRNERAQGGFRTASIEERTAALEARWEETVPTLATSKDISDLRGEMRNLENRLIKWIIGAAIALLAIIVAMTTANTSLITANTARIDRLDAKIDARFDTMMTRQDALDTKIDARFDAMVTRQDALDARMDARFEAIMAELRELRK